MSEFSAARDYFVGQIVYRGGFLYEVVQVGGANGPVYRYLGSLRG